MSINHEPLSALFEMSHEAVVGVKDNQICFSNPAAQAQFRLFAGDDAALFPVFLFSGECTAASLSVNGRAADLTVKAFEEMHLLFLRPGGQTPPDEEILTQLRAVRSFADSLMNLRMALDALLKRCRTDSDPRMAGYAAILYREYYRLRRLCSHVSMAENLARGSLPCSFAAVDLEKLVLDLADSVTALSETLGVEIACRCERGDYITSADHDLLETMLLNLISNSLLHTPRGGHVNIHLQCSGTRYILSVDDDGDGMAGEKLAGALGGKASLDLTDSQAGSGLGLLIAKGIAARHGGALVLESAPGHGCRVRVSLPRRELTETRFCRSAPVYNVRDLNGILTELSVVLPTSYYQERFFD